jgi:hypothetical protein
MTGYALALIPFLLIAFAMTDVILNEGPHDD